MARLERLEWYFAANIGSRAAILVYSSPQQAVVGIRIMSNNLDYLFSFIAV